MHATDARVRGCLQVGEVGEEGEVEVEVDGRPNWARPIRIWRC